MLFPDWPFNRAVAARDLSLGNVSGGVQETQRALKLKWMFLGCLRIRKS